MIDNTNLYRDLSKVHSQQSYTDLNSLQKIRQTGNEDKDLALKQVAQQFESMFIKMMLKSMRSANEVFGKDNPLNSSEMKHHQDMYDHQLSLSLSQSSNIGLADAFFRQMQNSYLPNELPNSGDDSIANQSTNTNLPPSQKTSEDFFRENTQNVQPLTGLYSLLAAESEKNTRNSAVSDTENNVANNKKVNSKNEEELFNNLQSPQDFIDAVKPFAQKIADKMGVDYRVLIAQTALETGWGEHVIRDNKGEQSFNLFNIKADSRWQGNSVAVPTIEYVDGIAQREVASFRRYPSIEDSFTDYQAFLNQPRYEKALSVAHNSNQFITELQEAGYATDPEYANKIQRILRGL